MRTVFWYLRKTLAVGLGLIGVSALLGFMVLEIGGLAAFLLLVGIVALMWVCFEVAELLGP